MSTTLRLTQYAESQADTYRVEVALEGDGARQTCSAKFNFKLSEQDHKDLRWYLEDFLQYPLDPAPKVAERVEKRIAEIGAELFKAVFQANDDARDLWATLREKLDDTRVEIITEVKQATAIPWELIRDPKTDVPLALRAQAFVRAQPNPAQKAMLPKAEKKIRILLVICRPGGDDDVPFRSVASRLIKGLSESDREAFQLDVLRPPTYEQLSKVLREAKANGTPYHVVHFDGHGVYLESKEGVSLSEILRGLMPLMLTGDHSGSHGYLVFENLKDAKENMMLVDGTSLGKLLVETDVPVLVLNACRSAHADAPTPDLTPDPSPEGRGENEDVHAQVRALGSLAQEVMDTGVAGVVAMRYNVYVVTAAEFVANVYAALAQGRALGEAVSFGRKQLAASPLREIAFAPIPLQDWQVPVVYEAASITLFPVRGQPQGLPLRIELNQKNEDGLPPAPDVGFFGRDETLLALDRAFDAQAVVLLHAYAGSGKTTTAVEFARWYAQTGGVRGAVLFTSFETHKPLARVLDEIGRVFGKALENSGVNWLALDDEARREVTLQVMKQIPILWIWDNVEPISGFPQGTPSAWSGSEQRALADFLRAARDTQAKFLLTSRRDEREWLGDLPQRIIIPPMPMQERVQLTRALAAKHGRAISEVQDWRPLLKFTGGNPLTITVLVGQALRNNLKSKEQIESFVAQLRAGEAVFDDEVTQGRSKSLGASLNYGFQNAFNEQERKVLALLHFFQGFVNVQVLQLMGHPEYEWHLPELTNINLQSLISLFDRAAEVGLLTAHSGGYYSIHPALPWYFKNLFDEYYGEEPSAVSRPPATNCQQPATSRQIFRRSRSFVEAMSQLAHRYGSEYVHGNREVINQLSVEEPNLLFARSLAKTNGWWNAVINCMFGLDQLYDQTGRRAEWKRLVEEIVPDFVDSATDLPLPGREEQWHFVSQYQIQLAQESRDWAKAEKLQRLLVDWLRRPAAPLLTLPPESLNDSQKNVVRTLAASLHQLGEIQRQLGQTECVKAYEETVDLAHRISDKAVEASAAFNLGNAYIGILALRDPAQAEQWYQRSLDLHDERDRLGRSKCHNQLGQVSYERFNDARMAKAPNDELLKHINDAVRFCHQGLDLLPPNAVNDLASAHNNLGIIYKNGGDLDRALHHYNESIRYEEQQGNFYGSATARFNVALALMQANRLSDAREYAYAALRNYEQYGEATAKEQEMTRGLIEEIEKRMTNAK